MAREKLNMFLKGKSASWNLKKKPPFQEGKKRDTIFKNFH